MVFCLDVVRSDSGCVSFFFFQAEDGIRDYKVTGVQTCALPISDQSFDPIKALRPAGMVARGHIAIVTGTRVPIATLADLAREAKAKTIFFATADRKSTRLNSSHLVISYAVFCLKKKKNIRVPTHPSFLPPRTGPPSDYLARYLDRPH